MHFLSFLIITTLGILPFCPLVYATSVRSVLRSLDTASVLHFTLNRHGGAFMGTEFLRDHVNLTYLAQELKRTESRFNLTKRVVKGNRLVRKAKLDEPLRPNGGSLMGKIVDDGLWFVVYYNYFSKVNFYELGLCTHTLIVGMPKSKLASHDKKSRWILTCWRRTFMSLSRQAAKGANMTTYFLKQVVMLSHSK